jgi:arginyl-tRNA synthetase
MNKAKMSSLKDQITKILEDITGVKDPEVDFASNSTFGDYSSNVCLRNKDLDPQKIAEEINKKDLSFTVQIVGKFINFYLKKDILIDNLIQISKQKEDFGKSDVLKSKKIMFEYAHPNTHKAFHIGHLRNITTGETLSRLHEAVGAKVIRANYQGDVGLHIAKALYGIEIVGFEDPKDVKKRAEFLGKAYARGATAYEDDEKAKERVGEINLKIYNKTDSKINELYEETRKWSLDYFGEIYERVYTKFDRLYFESECAESGKKTALEALKRGILEESKGAIIFKGSKYGLHDRVFVSGKGVPTYEGKDLGLAKLQFGEFNPDLLIHTVGPEQTEYFKVIIKALEFILPETKGREIHIPYGWVKLKEGKMSSRTGNVILGEDILDQAKEKILKSYKIDSETAEKVAVGAVKYSFLKTGLAQEIAFDLNESISLEGNSGPYIQYTYARTQSVLEKRGDYKIKISSKLTLSDEENEVLRKLSQFQEIIIDAAKNYSPNILCGYLYDLASKFNTFYQKHKIIGGEDENYKLLLTQGTGQVIKNGLRLLGIEAPKRM